MHLFLSWKAYFNDLSYFKLRFQQVAKMIGLKFEFKAQEIE